ncbi:hypothetical protein [Streptomyces violascens]|uniref:hypothetical protein n=1 Tax=Streptomyces violascens TaxID=67381 RepID=UPI003686D1F8
MAALGGVIVEPRWLGNSKPHRVVCSQGHETTPRPNDIKYRHSICRVCAGHDAETAWREFLALVERQGGTVVEPGWLGNKKPHRVVCKEGHESAVRPNNVQQGTGICRACAYKVWDVFYVVANDVAHTVKFGITSHDARARLRTHRADGYGRVILTISDASDAHTLERAVISSLTSAGIAPVRGREYYDLGVVPAILAVVDNWRSAAA